MTSCAILIPSFNRADTIAATLESIQAQGDVLKRVAGIYLSDDASSDETISVARVTWRDPVPLIIHEWRDNLGDRGNTNRGVQSIIAPVEWVLIVHSDDMVKPNWLPLMLDRMDGCSSQVASICSSWDTLWSNGVIEPGEDNPTRAVEVIPGTRESVRGTLIRGCWWHLSGCAIRLAAFKDVGGFAPEFPQRGDWEWLIRCLQRGWAVEYIPRTLLQYRQHAGSASAHLMASDRDLYENLVIVRPYAALLTRRQWLAFHVRLMNFAARRMGRAVLRRNVDSLGNHLYTLQVILRNLYSAQSVMRMAAPREQ